MRVIWIAPDGAEHTIEPTPDPSDPLVLVPGRCPVCHARDHRVRGDGNVSVSPDDRAYLVAALSACCGAPAGTIRAEPSTIFGIAEDERVLNGRARVYGAAEPRSR